MPDLDALDRDLDAAYARYAERQQALSAAERAIELARDRGGDAEREASAAHAAATRAYHEAEDRFYDADAARDRAYHDLGPTLDEQLFDAAQDSYDEAHFGTPPPCDDWVPSRTADEDGT